MEVLKGPYFIYWTSQYHGSDFHKGWTTPKYKGNMLSFDSRDKALAVWQKLDLLSVDHGEYRGRIVVHVAPFSY